MSDHLKALMRRSQQAAAKNILDELWSEPTEVGADAILSRGADEENKVVNEEQSERGNARQVDLGAKLWMASVKFVAPAVAVSNAMSADDKAIASVTDIILQQSTISAFKSLVDAVSCGAPFDNSNIFGLYRYALSNASSCTSNLTYTHKKVIAEFSSTMIAHLCGSLSGVKPISLRTIPETTTVALRNDVVNPDHLQEYLTSDYAKVNVSPEIASMISYSKSIYAGALSYIARSNKRVPGPLVADIMVETINDQMLHWTTKMKGMSNGGVIKANAKSDAGSVMVVQNALRLLSELGLPTTTNSLNKNYSNIYHPDAIQMIKLRGREQIDFVLKKVNAYVSAFNMRHIEIFDAVQNETLAYTKVTPEREVPAGCWYKLFDLPSKVAPFLTAYIAGSDLNEDVDLNLITDNIIYPAISDAKALISALNINSPWALKVVTDSVINARGHNLLRGANTWDLDLENYKVTLTDLIDKTLDRGVIKLLGEQDSSPDDTIDAIKVRLATKILNLDHLLCSRIGSKDRFKVIISVLIASIDEAIKSFVKITSDSHKPGKLLLLNGIIDASADLFSEILRQELRFNHASSEHGFIHDLLNDDLYYEGLKEWHKSTHQGCTEKLIDGFEVINSALNLQDASEKKPDAVLNVNPDFRAALTL